MAGRAGDAHDDKGLTLAVVLAEVVSYNNATQKVVVVVLEEEEEEKEEYDDDDDDAI